MKPVCGLTDADLLGMYRTMALARALDQKSLVLNRMGKAPFMISCQGQEGAQIGAAWAIAKGRDVVLPYYRDLGVMLTLGMTPYEILLGLLAKPGDPNSGGRQMPSHWGDPHLNVLSGSSPVATHLPHAAGVAHALAMRGDGDAAICFFGDGAASKGDFHEACNYAGIHHLPLVLVCENNGYAISVPFSQQSAAADVADYGRAYRFPGVVVDGNDTLAVYAEVDAALRRARAGGGPTLVECKTYRLLAHTSDDDDRTYRSPEEIEAWREKDPLPRLRRLLVRKHVLTDDDDLEIAASTKATIDDALARAEAAADHDPATARCHVWARPAAGTAGEDIPAGGVERSVIDAVRQVQHQLLSADPRVVILGEDVGRRGGVFRATDGLHAEFGDDRVIDTPLAESSIIGVAIGMALAGLRPIAEIQFADFIHSAFDQIVSEAAKLRYRSAGAFTMPLVIRTPWGGGVHGGLYHSQAIEAFYAHVAGLKVVVPSTPADAAGLLRAAVADPDPVLFLEHKRTYRLIKGMVPDGDWTIPIGQAAVARPGRDLTIVTYGLHRHLALEAAAVLAADHGTDAEVIDLRTISPLDRDTILTSVVKTGRLLIVHEDNVSFGVGAEVAAVVAEEAFHDLDAPIRRLAMPDVPAMPFAATLEHALSIGAADIVGAARALCAH